MSAIAVLLNRALRGKGIKAKTRRNRTILQILLEFEQAIDRAAVISLIRQGLERLQPANIDRVMVYAQPAGATQPLWVETFELYRLSAEATVDSYVDLPGNGSAESTETLMPSSGADAKATSTSSLSTQGAAVNVLRPKNIESQGIQALSIGLGLAIALFTINPLKVLFYGFNVMVHEVGHAVTHWLFGRPAIPTVNILHGGGVTLNFGQSWFLIGLIYLAMAFGIYQLRIYPRLQGVAVLSVVIYSFCLFTRTNTMLSTFMGHGMELVAIAVCLYLSASGYLCRFTGDRTIYAMLGFFTFFNDVEFSWKLTHDLDFRSWYEDGIGGVIDNDFMILANEYFGVDLSTIANAFLLACLMAPAIAFLVLRYQAWCWQGFQKLLETP